MAVSRLNKGDIHKVFEVLNLFFNREASIEQIEAFLVNDHNYLLVYEHENKVVGFAYGYELQRFDGRGNMMYMHQVEVHYEFRQKGIGRKLMESFIEICKRRDCDRLFLITNKSNIPAITLYHSVGGTTPHDDDLLYSFQL